MEGRGLKPATVYARVSRVSAFYRWLMSDPQLSAFIRPPKPAPDTRDLISRSLRRRSPTTR